MNTNLSTAELHLWQIVEDNPKLVADMSIIQLSQFANVSTATIVRTLKKMGYSGYTAYREQVRQNIGHSFTYNVLNDADKQIKNVILKNEIELRNTLKNLDYGTIEDSILAVKQASLVYVFARGLSTSLARELQIKLQLMGKYTELYDDPNIIKILSKKITHDCLVIFISLNGETKELLYAAKNLEKKDIPKIIFTTNNTGTLVNFADFLFLGYKSKKNYFPEFEVSSRLPLQVMVRIFLDAYAVRNQHK
ncbi:MurR/RpiR family transcriptional regulator [Ligilactobacillus sp. Marseille-Q7487]|uniref:MurR/RpiR family transcriptional regulator n=1 Tax=Ligilactobacillus sp. Marseille-Q7487 TaxID=3022128 RepID=UPI0024A9E61F|nr:MurR/RpiR family transcriptional regulator [Ligilactobacillus sp. Marseille-Q7487]